jgi:DNA polymerase-3 subunit beta
VDFYIAKSRLEPELSRIQSILPKKAPLPILENVLITSNEGKNIQFGASNLETTLTTIAVADQIINHGSLCLPATALYDIIRLMPDGMIHFESIENNRTKISAGKSNFKLPGVDPQEFLPLPQAAEEPTLTFPAKLLKNLFNGVKFAIGPETDSRFTYSGVKFEADGESIRAAATDSHRLAVAVGTPEEIQMEGISLILTQRVLEDLGKLITDSEEVVGISEEQNSIHFVIGNRHLSGRLLVGDFPDYQMIIDAASKNNTSIVISRTELVQSLKRASLAADKQSRAVLFSFENGKVTLSAKTTQTGEVVEVMDIAYSGDPFKVTYSAKYLLDFIDSVDTVNVIFGIKGKDQPVFLSSESQGIKHGGIVAPMRSDV